MMELSYPIAAALASVGLALVHLLAGKLRFLEGVPRSRWLSMSSGVSVAYVFLHLIPEIVESQQQIARTMGNGLGFAERHVYIVALLGLTTFLGLERLAEGSRIEQRREREGDHTSPGVFWVHIVSFSVYNLLIGNLLLHRKEQAMQALVLFFIAIALHFLVNDFGMREHHKEQYDRTGRWILAVAVLAGAAIGYVTAIPPATTKIVIAFLAGGIILNVLKEELPRERESRFWTFLVGTAAYSVLLLVQ